MAKRIVLAGILGVIAVFLLQSVAHMLLPLGDAGLKALSSEPVVLVAALVKAAPSKA